VTEDEVIFARFETDLATGMPWLPEGHYWVVKFRWPEFSAYPRLYVAVRKRLPLFFWKTIVDQDGALTRLDPRDIKDPEVKYWGQRKHDVIALTPEEFPAAVLEYAAEALVKESGWFVAAREHQAITEAMERLTGTYPPKKLTQ